MTSTRTGRWVRLDGTTNTRDLGGLPTTDGGAHAARPDPAQRQPADPQRRTTSGGWCDEIGLREVIDLRTTAEILLEGRGPLRDVPEVTHRHFSLLPERGHHTDVFAVEEDDPLGDLPAGWVESLLPRAGRRRTTRTSRRPSAPTSATSPTGGDHVVGALRALDGGRRRARRWCTARRARTAPGVVVALALAVAGVPHEEIVADYAMTADVIDALVAKLAASPTYAEDMDRRDVASHTPRAETMDRVLTLLDERFGGPIGWLEAHGFGADEQAALQARLRD